MSDHIHLTLMRHHFSDKSTHGILLEDDLFIAYTLEDTFRAGEKIRGRTCIPYGHNYQLVLREEETPLTHRYRSRYSWFEYFIEIEGVQNFSHIYFHIGNDHEDTEGCVLLGNSIGYNTLGNSTAAMKRFYDRYYEAVKERRVTLDVDRFYTWNRVV